MSQIMWLIKLKEDEVTIIGVVKDLSRVEFFFISRIFFENFQISQLDQCNFNFPQMPKIMKRATGSVQI